MRPGAFATLAGALLLLPVAAGSVIEPRMDTAWAQHDRDLTAFWNNQEFTLRSTVETAERQDDITVSYDRATHTLRYRIDATQPDNVSREYALSVQGLLEFRDLDGDGHYGLGDPVLQSFPVAEMQGGAIRVESLQGGRQEASVSYRLPGHFQSTFDLRVLMTPTRDAGDGALLDPSHARVSVAVEGFPFEPELDTRLAIDLRWEGRLARVGPAVAHDTGPFRFSHEWDPAAVADRAQSPANATVQGYTTPTGEQTIVALAFEPASRIDHTWTIGTDRFSGDLEDRILRSIVGEWRLYLLGLVAAALVVGGPLYYRRRRDP